MVDNEQFYDAEIAPVLAQLGQKCMDRGMSFLAVAEYRAGDWGRTAVQMPDQSLPLTIMHIAAQTGQNVDALMINIARHCRKHGIDTSSSMYLSRFGAAQ